VRYIVLILVLFVALHAAAQPVDFRYGRTVNYIKETKELKKQVKKLTGSGKFQTSIVLYDYNGGYLSKSTRENIHLGILTEEGCSSYTLYFSEFNGDSLAAVMAWGPKKDKLLSLGTEDALRMHFTFDEYGNVEDGWARLVASE